MAVTTGEDMKEKQSGLAKEGLLEGLSERDLQALYTACPVRKLRREESLVTDAREEAIYLVAEGSVSLGTKSEAVRRPRVFTRGECIGPVELFNWTNLTLVAAEPITLLEMTPTVLTHLPERVQAAVYRKAARWNAQLASELICETVNLRASGVLLSSYAKSQAETSFQAVSSGALKDFMLTMPKLPVHATQLATKLLDDGTSVQEVVDALKNDLSVASIVLKTVNSARFAFNRKIETLYHACMILGYNNIYQLIMREALQAVMPPTLETESLHQHAFTMSTISYQVSVVTRQGNPQIASTIGLLHDIGKSVLVLFRTKHPELAGMASLVDPSVVGNELLTLWGIPDRIQKVVGLQRYPEFAPPNAIDPDYWTDVALLYVAHLCEAFLHGRPVKAQDTVFMADYFALLNIAPADPGLFFKEELLPALIKDRKRLAPELRELIPQV